MIRLDAYTEASQACLERGHGGGVGEGVGGVRTAFKPVQAFHENRCAVPELSASHREIKHHQGVGEETRSCTCSDDATFSSTAPSLRRWLSLWLPAAVRVALGDQSSWRSMLQEAECSPWHLESLSDLPKVLSVSLQHDGAGVCF